MKIELCALNGSNAHSCLAIRCLQTALLEAGYADTHCAEFSLRDRTATVLSHLVGARANVYSFSCYIYNVEQTLALARDVKTLLPDCHVVFGGPEASFATDRFTALPFVDTVITGEGEEAIVTLMGMLERGETPPSLLEGTPDGRFEERGVPYDLSRAPATLLYYESSRGCPYSCAFCLSSVSRGVRAKSAEKTLADLLEFEKSPASFVVKLVDRTFNFDRERAKKIWRVLLSESYTKCYHFEICASLLDEESFDILSKFPKGKVQLEIGLQSANEKTLAAISRHTNAEAVLKAAARLKAQGNIHVHLDLIAGLPFEDMASFARSFDKAYPHADMLQLGFLKLLHGTALRENAKELGLKYSATPPYTVLETPYISFEEMCLLHRVEEVMERLTAKGRFVHTLHFLMAQLPSPFGVFEGFASYLQKVGAGEIQKISQRDLFVHLSAWGKQRLPACHHEALVRSLEADFSSFEVRKPPKL